MTYTVDSEKFIQTYMALSKAKGYNYTTLAEAYASLVGVFIGCVELNATAKRTAKAISDKIERMQKEISELQESKNVVP